MYNRMIIYSIYETHPYGIRSNDKMVDPHEEPPPYTKQQLKDVLSEYLGQTCPAYILDSIKETVNEN